MATIEDQSTSEDTLSEDIKLETPTATCIDSNSITIAWSPPKNGSADTRYQVSCSRADGKIQQLHTRILEGISNEQQLLTFSNLASDTEYAFQIQASDSPEIMESEPITITTTEYFDIMLVGKTGQGKSTLGNKLIHLDHTTLKSKIRLFESEDAHFFPPSHDLKKKRFTQASDPEVTEKGDNILSVTANCKLLANDETRVRVMDVPGFSDSGAIQRAAGTNVSVFEANLQIIRWVVKAQIRFQLQFRRIVYFLPVRGPLEKADGSMQEELKVLYHFFGKEVFDRMVVAATLLRKEAIQKAGFDNDDVKETKRVFQKALEFAIPGEKIKCPPLVFIGFNDRPSHSIKIIKEAKVFNNKPLPLNVQKGTCTRCSAKIRYRQEEGKIENEAVEYKDDTTVSYSDSKCHPKFVPKYTFFQRAAGGIAHMATLGIGLIVAKATDKKSWPGFTNSDEICFHCQHSPGALGCLSVGVKIQDPDGKCITVDHSNEL